MHFVTHNPSPCQGQQSTLPGCPAAILPPSHSCPRPPSTKKPKPDPLPLGQYRPEALIPGVHSYDAAASLVPFLPECQALADSIARKDLEREISNLRRSPRGAGQAEALLVYNSKSHPAHLPPWSCIPTTPTWSYQLFAKDAYVCRNLAALPPTEKDATPRAVIYEFSDKSKAHLDHICSNSGHLIKSQFCLTYRNQNPTDGEAIKTHLDKWLKSMRRRCPGFGYIWVLEFQKRGVPHFHVFLTIEVKRKLQEKMAKSWVKITNGDEQQLKWHNRRNNFITWKMQTGSYLTKNYCVKSAQKDVPGNFRNVGRFWGSSRSLSPVSALITPETLSNITKNKAIPWEPEAIRHYFDKILRRYQEKQMNYQKKYKMVENIEGEQVPWTTIDRRREQRKRKSSIIRQQSELSGCFKIKNGSQIIYQLMNYVADHPPDRISLQRAIKERIPF